MELYRSLKNSQSTGLDESALKDINNKITRLQIELDSLRNEFLKWIKDFQD